jgi:hypothetical protein
MLITVLAQVTKASENASLYYLERGGGRAPVNVTARYSRGCKKNTQRRTAAAGGSETLENPHGENS